MADKRFRAVAIDDQPGVLALYEAMLEDTAIELVATATTGREGIDLVRDIEPDLVLLDLGMPDMDGLEILQRLRAGIQRPRIAIVSGFGALQMEETTRRLGAELYIEKGKSPNAIVQDLECLVERGRVADELI